jgi:hypothetical protein
MEQSIYTFFFTRYSTSLQEFVLYNIPHPIIFAHDLIFILSVPEDL